MSTYKQILYLLGWIAMSFLDENPLISKSGPDYASVDELTTTIVNGFTHISKDTVADTVKAYRDLQEKMHSIIETKNNGLKKLENEKQWDDVTKFIDYLDELSWHLYLIKFVLIPRVFMLSGSKKICTALANLDTRLLLYEQDIISHRKSAREKGAMYPSEIADLVDRAADIYEAVCENLTPEEMDEWRISDEESQGQVTEGSEGSYPSILTQCLSKNSLKASSTTSLCACMFLLGCAV